MYLLALLAFCICWVGAYLTKELAHGPWLTGGTVCVAVVGLLIVIDFAVRGFPEFPRRSPPS